MRRPSGIAASVPLSPLTTMGVGGPAEHLVVTASPGRVLQLLRWAEAESLPVTLLGGASNVIVSDAGLPGLIVLFRGCTSPLPDPVLSPDGDNLLIRTTASRSLAALARSVTRLGLTGLEWATGVPGTVGGALVGNSGSFHCSMSDVVTQALIYDPGRPMAWTPASELGLDYRRSNLRERQGRIVLEVEFALRHGDLAQGLILMEQYTARRATSQPRGRSAGSVFRNPEGQSAGRLIDSCGLKGTRIGGAVISTKHANFILNDQGATAADVVELINLSRRTVWREFGILLEPEVRLLGGLQLEDVD